MARLCFKACYSDGHLHYSREINGTQYCHMKSGIRELSNKKDKDAETHLVDSTVDMGWCQVGGLMGA
jgi:hypothetical protein